MHITYASMLIVIVYYQNSVFDYRLQSLGNHEFDNGIEGLLPFLRNISFPVVCSNILLDREPELNGLIQRSIVVKVNDQDIGIVGYLTKETPALSKTGMANMQALYKYLITISPRSMIHDGNRKTCLLQ